MVVFRNQRKFRDMMPYVVAVMMATQVFFLTLIVFIESPFKVLMAGKRVVDVGDGQGLSALLQYWTMIIHPPMLYLGYVGFVVPFAFAMASLITKQPGEAWIHVTTALDAGDLDVPDHRSAAGRGLGLRGARLGRLLGMGSGGERIAAAVDHGDGVPAFRDDAGEKRNDEGVEHGAGFGHILPVHLWDVLDAQRAS